MNMADTPIGDLNSVGKLFQQRKQSLGLVETRGYVAAIAAADAMVKSAYVELLKIEKIGSGLVTVLVNGDIASIKAALETAGLSADQHGDIIAIHAIARPADDLPAGLGLLEEF